MPMLLIIPGNARVLTRSVPSRVQKRQKVPTVSSRLIGSTGEKKRESECMELVAGTNCWL